MAQRVENEDGQAAANLINVLETTVSSSSGNLSAQLTPEVRKLLREVSLNCVDFRGQSINASLFATPVHQPSIPAFNEFGNGENKI